MPNFKVNQAFSNGSKNIYISASDEATAQTIVNSLCSGEITVEVEATGVTGTDASETSVGYKRFEVSLSNAERTERTYLQLLVADTKSADDVKAALLNKSINGVHCDNVTFNNIVTYTV